VSNWTHDLIMGMPELNFHLLTIIPPQAKLKLRYALPENITGITHISWKVRSRKFFPMAI